jgi:pimeloyl-ACP methyl ester carboxylesterase
LLARSGVLFEDGVMTDLVLHRSGRPADEAPVLVLLHGHTDSGPSWADAIARWEHAYHVVAVDQRGHGESPRFTEAEFERGTTDVMNDDTVALLAELAAETGRSSLLAGHSMGARLAGLAAAQSPDLVAAVVLEDPPWWLPIGGPSPWERRAAEAPATSSSAAEPNPAPDPAEPTVDELIAAQRVSSPNWPESELRPWAEAKGQYDVEMGKRRRDRMRDWTETVGGLTMPALLVTGTDNVLIGPDVRDEVRRIAPDVEIVVIEDAGHCVRRDQRVAYYAAVDAFLEANKPEV